MAYLVVANILMAYIVMACSYGQYRRDIVELGRRGVNCKTWWPNISARGRCRSWPSTIFTGGVLFPGLHSCGLDSDGPYSYDLDSYGLYSDGGVLFTGEELLFGV